MNHTENHSPRYELSSVVAGAIGSLRLKKTVFSKPKDKTIQKAVLTVKETQKKRFAQIEIFHKDNKVTHKNLAIDEEITDSIAIFAEDFAQINVICSDGECEYRCSSSGKEVLLGVEKLRKRLTASTAASVAPTSNNREKKHILDGSEPFLRRLDVSDENGRIYDRRQPKFRQINRFLELIRDVEDKLPKENIVICDLCCGKSYLSFAVYHYFANIKGYKVTMTGVDLKSDVIEHCNAVARDLQFDGLSFVCGDICQFTPDQLPSLVISLHACDIATDLVLTKAADWGTEVILSTPCCHHELNHNIDCETLSFITEYSMLRQKLCDAATDALRLCRLEAQGYSTIALELIDPDETPKNIMLRAIKKKHFDPNSPAAQKARERYEAAKKFLCADANEKGLHF